MSPRSNTEYPGGLKQYIRDRVIVREETGCWIWQKAVDGSGFPKCRVKKAYWGVNRLAYTLWVGEIPAGKAVRQECLNKLCCNPEHLLIANVGKVPGLDYPALEDRTQCHAGHPWPEFLAMRADSKNPGEKKPACKECDRLGHHRRKAAARLRDDLFRMVT